ncbi:MAG: signal recognition particle protein [bacterium]
MFDNISSKLYEVMRKIKGTGVITEKNIEDALKEIRMALLEADVSYKVVKAFIDSVKTKALGEVVLKAISPGQQFIKIVNDELVSFLGDAEKPLDYSKQPLLILLVGLQGSGKTTIAAKLARFLKTEKNFKKLLLVGADTYRPAAKDQLKKLASTIDVPFYTEDHNDAIKIVQNAYTLAQDELYQAVIFDTAGRLHIDEDMLAELKKMKALIPFTEILLVADSMLGQEAVNIAKGFNEALGITGLVLTKVDGDSRGGAALSMKYITAVPIKFMGTGEKLEKFEYFYPERVASRILGMGDVVSLVEHIEKTVAIEDAQKAEAKFRKANFNLEDFLEQMQAMKKMGPMEDLLKMIPGGAQLGNINIDEKHMKSLEAIILSMTPKERNHPEIINDSRKKRIAKGSGTTSEKVNKLLKQFAQARKMMKQMSRKKHGKPSFPGMPF